MIRELPAVRLGDVPSPDEPGRRARSKHPGDEPLRLADLSGREYLGQHSKAEGEHGHAHPLNRADSDQTIDLVGPAKAKSGTDVRREPGNTDSDRVDSHRDQEHALLAVNVTQLAEDGGHDDADEQIRR